MYSYIIKLAKYPWGVIKGCPTRPAQGVCFVLVLSVVSVNSL